jgi:hypothetical protein
MTRDRQWAEGLDWVEFDDDDGVSLVGAWGANPRAKDNGRYIARVRAHGTTRYGWVVWNWESGQFSGVGMHHSYSIGWSAASVRYAMSDRTLSDIREQVRA